MEDKEQRDRESRESDTTKFEQAREREAEQRADLAERLPDPPEPQEENGGD
jgi:hypothetical protein